MSDNKYEELATKKINNLKFQKVQYGFWNPKMDIKFKIEPYGENLSFLELQKGKTTLFIHRIYWKNFIMIFFIIY